MIKPHGGKLIKRVADERLKEEAKELPTIEISRDTALDIENIGFGIYSPLEGFMSCDDFESVIWRGRLANDLPWTIPIVLDVDDGVREGEEVLLTHRSIGIAVMEIEELYRYNKKEYARQVFGTEDIQHPGVRKVFMLKDKLAGGKITFIESVDKRFQEYDLKPEETREIFRKWDYVVGFQTRNAPHLGHEFVQKSAMLAVEAVTGGEVGLFINPVIGRKKKGDFRDEVILEAYKVVIDNYYRPNRVFLGIWKTEMRYAGPKEAILHAIVRQNFGCTHFIVGRDHAGVGSYYKPYEAHEIFKEYESELEIRPLFFKDFHCCQICGGVISVSICPHNGVKFSGTCVRSCIQNSEAMPCEMLRKEVIDVISKFEKPFVEEEYEIELRAN
jgi:sulfate adenylyltransferase